MNVKIIFPASMKGVGLLYHFTYLTLEFAKQLRGTNYSFLMLTEKGEQNIGLLNIVKDNLIKDEYMVLDSHKEFKPIVESYLEDENFDKVFYLTQGLIQFTHSIKLKIKYSNKLVLYTRLNSFKHGSFYRAPLSFVYSLLFYKYADVVNFQCEYTISKFSNSKILLKKGLDTIIPLGLNSPEVIKDPEKNELNSIMDNNSIYKIVYLAQFHKHKRHFELINSLKDYLKSNNDINLILFGDGIELDNIKKLCNQFNILDKVYFAGRVDRKFVPFYLKKSNLSVVLSKVETFGHNILEPLFYGIPVISANIGIASDVIRDFYNGFVLRSNNFKRLPGIIESFKQLTDKDLIIKSVHQYTWSDSVKSYIKMFNYLSLKK